MAELVIAHVSDLHVGAHSQAAVESLPADVAAAAPTLTVVTGDLTMRARTGQFRRVSALLEALPRPRLVILGNHDVPLDPRRLAGPYRFYQRWIEPDLDPVLRLPGLCAVGLNSMPWWRWKDGRVTERQAAMVAAMESPGVRLVALHHPLVGHGRLLGRRRLSSALAAGKVHLLLAGHQHVPSSRYLDVGGTHRVLQVVAGTATSVRTRKVGRSWTLIRVGAAGIDVEERHEVDGRWRPWTAVHHPSPS
jgi:3',5'-cyclic AMP phosphodiesterase CpdA